MEDSSKEPQKSRTSRLKVKLACAGLVIVVLLICMATFAFLWFGGFIKQFMCSNVVSGSELYNTLQCQNVTSLTPALTPPQSTTQVVTSEEQVVTSVVAKSAPGVVAVGIKGDSFHEDQIIGTGFIVTKDGLIVTNRHVVADESVTYFVNLNGSNDPIPTTKIYRDPVNDLALIKIDKTNLTALPLGDSDKIVIGQTAIAIGNPLGKFQGTVTSGIVSGLHRQVNVSEGFFNDSQLTYDDVIQTDAAINPGNSGGPMLNADGQVVGINFATISGASNMSFALPINRAKSRLEELSKFGHFRIAFLGVQYRERIVFVNGKSTVGAEVTSVVADSPAAKAGIQKNDIIVEFNGNDLSAENLSSLIQKTTIGQSVKVGIVRAGQSQEVTITVGERDEGL